MSRPIQYWMSFIIGALCLATVGCGEPPTIAQYLVADENPRNLTSDLLQHEFPPIPFRWDVPKTWALASNDQFSLRAWNTGPPAKQARITLGKFPAMAGIPAQVQRWRRQLGLEIKSEDQAMQDVKALSTQNGGGSYAKIEGETETILAFILPIETQLWIFRFKGPNTTVKTEGDQFHKFCTKLEYVESPMAEPKTTRARTPFESKPESAALEPPPQSAAQPSQTNEPPPQEPAKDESTSDPAASDPPTNTESDSDAAQPASESSADGE